jgi:hypothetical protein
MSKKERIAELECGMENTAVCVSSLQRRVEKLESAPMAHADLEQRLRTLGEMEQRVRRLEVRWGEPPQAAPADEQFFKDHVPTDSAVSYTCESRIPTRTPERQGSGYPVAKCADDCMHFTPAGLKAHSESVRSQALQDTNSDEIGAVMKMYCDQNALSVYNLHDMRRVLQCFLTVRRGRV